MRNLAVLAIIITALILTSCGGSEPVGNPPSAPVPSPSTSAVDAKALYSNNCAVCHGEKRQGVSGLGQALTPTSLAKLSDAEIRATILKGSPNTAMAGFEGRLSSEQIEALLQLIKYTSP